MAGFGWLKNAWDIRRCERQFGRHLEWVNIFGYQSHFLSMTKPPNGLPSSVETCLFSLRSVLFPTSMMMTSVPRSVLTSSIHLDVWLELKKKSLAYKKVENHKDPKTPSKLSNLIKAPCYFCQSVKNRSIKMLTFD